jgi:hypothetical protein
MGRTSLVQHRRVDTIGSAQTADNAAYSVLVTNSAGSIPSSNATLTVTVASPEYHSPAAESCGQRRPVSLVFGIGFREFAALVPVAQEWREHQRCHECNLFAH